MKMHIVSLMSGLAVAAALAVPAQSAGFGTFFANMNAAGVTVSSSGVGASAKTAVGRYEVTFNTNINGCAALVNVVTAVPAYGVARKKVGTNNVLQVTIFNKNGVLTDFPTNVFIMCNS